MRVRRTVAALAAVVAGAGVLAVGAATPAGADVALVDVECDLPSAGGLGGGFVPATQTIEDLEVEVVDAPDPVVQGQPLSYTIDLPVPNITDGLDLPPEFAPYGTLEINHVNLDVPIPAGFTTSTAQVSMSPSVPWLQVSEPTPGTLRFRVESTVAGNSPTSRSPMRIDLDAASPVIEVQQTPGVWVPVTPLPVVTLVGTATGPAGSTIDLKPPSLTVQVQYVKQVGIGGFLLDIQWNDANVPCVPLQPNQAITTTAVVAAAPGLTVVKAAPTAVLLGDDVDYTITLTNTGNVPLTGVDVVDVDAPGCDGPRADLPVGGQDVVTCSVTPGATGTVSNIASVDTDQVGPISSNLVSTAVNDPPPPCLPPEFPDVGEGHPFFIEICWMVGANVTGGYPDGTFRPSNPVTRQAMAAFLQRLSGEPTPEDCTQTFSDVSTGHPFVEEICWMVDAQITGGYSDNTFRPGANVSRAAMAAFLYRFDDASFEEPAIATFPDVGTGHPFFLEVEWMVDAGITGGYPDNTYRPGASVTRQSMAAFLYRLSNPV